MSEYWKSTPKYWCKHCKTYVRDTGLERKNHEATAKHQGNLQRFLRGLHKENDREQREKLRAKDEVDRLNGVIKQRPTVPGERGLCNSSSGGSKQQFTPADRQRQLQQLADMGVAVPEDFRKEAAIMGDWQTTSRRVVYEHVPQRDGLKKEDENGDSKPALNIGVRKRKLEGQEEEVEAGEKVVRKGWGSTTRAFPASNDVDDLDVLLNNTKARVAENGNGSGARTAIDEPAADQTPVKFEPSDTPAGPMIKTEGPSASMASELRYADIEAFPEGTASPPIKQEDEPPVPSIVFKKRKAKSLQPKG